MAEIFGAAAGAAGMLSCVKHFVETAQQFHELVKALKNTSTEIILLARHLDLIIQDIQNCQQLNACYGAESLFTAPAGEAASICQDLADNIRSLMNEASQALRSSKSRKFRNTYTRSNLTAKSRIDKIKNELPHLRLLVLQMLMNSIMVSV